MLGVDVGITSLSGFAPLRAVADSLASNFHQELRKTAARPGMSQELTGAGYKHFLTDVTGVVIAPLDPATVARWERLTGYEHRSDAGLNPTLAEP